MFGLTIEDITDVITSLRRAEPRLNTVCGKHPYECRCYVCSACGLVNDAIHDLAQVRRQLLAQEEPAPF